ncbi:MULTISPECIES: 3-isopropylmalate dehydrogenase [unclassified Leucobacter]|uniref:3-isopropylmalate dehydrogenase n=1 Tax=unclassified Leucobacter TaxID=2621730 RepID=UPI00165E9887|nr:MULTISPECIES: 3-isopropylmalate dehydrogenase [unclassified Leucobacter]MBC9928258.1 3-isopropylmalate dehydrogenase [Leucobacter sp. cx-169]MBC9937487.1 3-isopropylmalate dehydrogenase [Leucobacter sp. cx-87]
MTRSYRIAVLPGDGIGPEVVGSALEVLDAAEKRFGFHTDRSEYAAGANHYLETGELFDELEAELRDKDAILFGSMGDPRVTPGILERGFILEMRQRFQQAANVRPVRLYPGVPTPIVDLTPERCELVIVRENTEGAYVGQGSTVHRGTPNAVAMQESLNTRAGIERVVDFAFRLAVSRRKKLTLCHKTNILVAAGQLWQEVVNDLSAHYPEVETDYVHVDAMCFHLPLTPERFDVVVTDNLFGDIITDLGAVIQGGLGVATSANLNLDGSAPSMFEAIHGSAPDIAGKGWANPSGSILSLALMLGHLGEGEAAQAIEAATVQVLGELPALAGAAMGASTAEVGARVAEIVRGGSYDTALVPNSLLGTLAELAPTRLS